jgi:hypothetical protein
MTTPKLVSDRDFWQAEKELCLLPSIEDCFVRDKNNKIKQDYKNNSISKKNQ